MSKPFALQTVLDLMQSRSDAATQRLARLIAAEQSEKGKHALLQQYRDEYSARFRQAAQDGLTQPQWRNFQQFLDRLDEALDQQALVVRRQETQTAAGQAEWQQHQVKLKAFDALAARHHATEARNETRLEQKVQDEHAARSGQSEAKR
jgi:flagellar FliJ protein